MEATMSAVIGGGFEEFAAAFGLHYRNMSSVIGGIQKRFETVCGQEVLVMSLVIGGEMRTFRIRSIRFEPMIYCGTKADEIDILTIVWTDSDGSIIRISVRFRFMSFDIGGKFHIRIAPGTISKPLCCMEWILHDVRCYWG